MDKKLFQLQYSRGKIFPLGSMIRNHRKVEVIEEYQLGI